MSSDKAKEPEINFSKLYKNRLEKRIVDYLEAIAQVPDADLRLTIMAQKALVAKSIENIALMLSEQGYFNNWGYFVRFTPQDLLTIQQALAAALKLRADIMMEPLGLEALTKAMGLADKVTGTGPTGSNPHTGLSEAPPMSAVDGPSIVVEETVQPIKEEVVANYTLVKK